MTDQPFVGPVARQGAIDTQCMNWAPYGLAEIWQMLENENGRTSWAQVSAWNRMGSLCVHQAVQLRRAADALAGLWPPEQSEASRLFREKVISLAKLLDESANTADANARALSNLTVGISTTRKKVSVLVERQEAIRAAQAKGLNSIQRDDLDDDARRIMRDADVIPARAVSEFRIPHTFDGMHQTNATRPIDIDLEGALVNEGSRLLNANTAATQIALPAPLIEPPPPTTPTRTEMAGPGASSSPILEASTYQPTIESSKAEGLGPPPARSGGQPSPIGQAQPYAGAPGMVGPGGIIGSPRTPIGPATGPTTQAPVRGAAGTPSSMPAGMVSPMVPNTGHASRGQAKARGHRPRTGGPSDEWSVPQGHPAVIEPRDEPTYHDPGPGVIGIDR